MEDQSESENSTVAIISETAVDLLAGISLPAPIRRNALKAFDQLCAALIDIPVSHLEGFAQTKRAENAARVGLIAQSAEQIRSGIEVDPSYARAAATKYAQKIVRERRSLDNISSIATTQLEELDHDSHVASEEEISDDWINSFENEASQKSSAEMQELFGSILAGEITKPGSFSIRAVKILGQMNSTTALLFQNLCSVAISLEAQDQVFDVRVPSLGGNAASNSLSKYGFNFDNLNTLQEYGLVISDLNSFMDYRPSIVQNNSLSLGLSYAGQLYALVPKQDQNLAKELKIHGVMFTKAGRELMRVVPKIANESYTNDLRQFFDSIGFTLTTVQTPAT